MKKLLIILLAFTLFACDKKDNWDYDSPITEEEEQKIKKAVEETEFYKKYSEIYYINFYNMGGGKTPKNINDWWFCKEINYYIESFNRQGEVECAKWYESVMSNLSKYYSVYFWTLYIDTHSLLGYDTEYLVFLDKDFNLVKYIKFAICNTPELN